MPEKLILLNVTSGIQHLKDCAQNVSFDDQKNLRTSRGGIRRVGPKGWDIVQMMSISIGETSMPVEQQFSSGELARLALAMEYALLSIEFEKDAFASQSRGENGDVEGECCLLVCDEIDAHIGGEASNAAARLLRLCTSTNISFVETIEAS